MDRWRKSTNLEANIHFKPRLQTDSNLVVPDPRPSTQSRSLNDHDEEVIEIVTTKESPRIVPYQSERAAETTHGVDSDDNDEEGKYEAENNPKKKIVNFPKKQNPKGAPKKSLLFFILTTNSR